MGTNVRPPQQWSALGAVVRASGGTVIERPAMRLASGGALALGLHPAALSGFVQPLAFVVAIAVLSFGCVLLLRSRKKDREEAEAERVRHARQMDELVHAQQVRIQEAVERGSLRSRERADHDLQERLNAVLAALGDGFGQLDDRLDAAEQRERDREEAVRSRLDEAMLELRRAGRASVRFVLEQLGLHNALEDLCWTLEASGKMRVALQMQGLGMAFGPGEQTSIYRLVNDAVDTSLGYERVDRMAIRLERSAGKCLLSVQNNGGDALGDHRVSDEGRHRLEGRVAHLNGSIDRGTLPQGGHTLNVIIPLGQ